MRLLARTDHNGIPGEKMSCCRLRIPLPSSCGCTLHRSCLSKNCVSSTVYLLASSVLRACPECLEEVRRSSPPDRMQQLLVCHCLVVGERVCVVTNSLQSSCHLGTGRQPFCCLPRRQGSAVEGGGHEAVHALVAFGGNNSGVFGQRLDLRFVPACSRCRVFMRKVSAHA